MKTVLFVPGYMEDLKDRDYNKTIRQIESKGYKVRFIPIKWRRSAIQDWVNELDLIYKNYNPKQTILAGFSFGAMTAFVSAAKRNPAELWLFSLSPYFKEDIASPTMRPAWLKIIGKHRTKAFAKLNFFELAKEINCKTLLFAGQIELKRYIDLNRRVNEASNRIKNSKLFIAKEAGHDVANQNYIDTILKAIY